MPQSVEGLISAVGSLYSSLLSLFGGVALIDRPDSESATGNVETVCDPTEAQFGSAQILHREYERWARIIAAFLRRIDGDLAQGFDERSEALSAYFPFQRTD